MLQLLLLFFFALKAAHASPYIEAGTSMGKATDPDALVGKSLGTPGSGFVGSFNLYFPLTPLKNVAHFELGLQNRFTILSGSNGSAMMITPNASARIEFWRFYVGAGYAPRVFVDMKPVQDATAYFGEAGVIWRVVPEFQICATFAMEYGQTPSGASPSPSSEYGLRFRFPLDPKEYTSSGRSVDFDGFRYPFGVMR